MLKVIPENFGKAEILFVTQNIASENIVQSNKRLKSKTTSTSSKVTQKLFDVRKQIKELVSALGSDIESVKTNSQASCIEITVGLTISAEGKLIIGAKAEGSISLTMKWEK